MDPIICAGHLNWDVTLRVDALPEPDGEAAITDRFEGGGGSAANASAVLAGLEREPLLLGSVGDDDYGRDARDELASNGVDVSLVKTVGNADTTVKYLVVDATGELMILANEGANERYTAADLPAESLEEARHLHLTGQSPAVARHLAERASRAGLSVSFDPGRRIVDREYGPVFPSTDVVFFNRRELSLARDSGFLAQPDTDPLCVVKLGGSGAVADPDGAEITHEGFDVSPVDTAGAGDAFDAGFIAAYLTGAGVDHALAVGNACGAIAVQSRGARVEITWDDVATYCDIGFLDR